MRKNGRKHGEVYTKNEIVTYLLDEVDYCENYNLKDFSIVEPCAGKGAFALEIISRLYKSSKKYGFDFIDAINKNILFFEKDEKVYSELIANISSLIYNLGYNYKDIDSKKCFLNNDYLTFQFTTTVNCIVGNPPYIRHENILDEYKLCLKKEFTTFKYRADLYIPFYEKSLGILCANGALSFICSNRWLYNQYGKPLRQLVAEQYHLKKLLNIEKTSPFDETVIGYPCITTISNSRGKSTYFYETSSKKIDLINIVFRNVKSPQNASWENLFLDYDIEHPALKSIKEQGFDIGIGVATGADKVYILKGEELNGIERSCLLPVIKSNALKSNKKIEWDNSFVINPYENGTLKDLNLYPHLNDYLSFHKKTLENRHTAKKNPKSWYKTIDKIKPEILKQPKLLLPDLAGGKYLFIDKGEYYPHHNVYYITHSDIKMLKVLAAILMSAYIKNQISSIGIKMNGGLPRFQSQTLKKIRIPVITLMSLTDIETLIKAYDKQNLLVINNTIDEYCTQHCT